MNYNLYKYRKFKVITFFVTFRLIKCTVNSIHILVHFQSKLRKTNDIQCIINVNNNNKSIYTYFSWS